jgi:anti-sigma regulatory factor (Ser/Thr protein kinase)
LQGFVELEPQASGVPCGRRRVRQWLLEWNLASLSETAELVASELLTNAVRASRLELYARVRLWLLSDSKNVLIVVWDASPQPPTRIDAGAEAENGRGLLLVEAICTRWGWHHAREPGGKVVWAQIGAEPR